MLYLDLAVAVLLLYLPARKAAACVKPTVTENCACFLEQNLTVINCRYNQLKQIPIFINTSMVYDKIQFSGSCESSLRCNSITSLPANAFANLRVKSIDLLDNPISTVNLNAFNGLKNVLEELMIQGSGNEAPPYQAMASNENLKVLWLKKYRQTSIASNNSLLPFPSLHSLILEDFKDLTSITATFSVLAALTKLQLITIPTLTAQTIIPAIVQFRNLKQLTLTGTGMTNILADSFRTFTSLKELDISKNDFLMTINVGAFNGMENTLEILDLSNNKLVGSGLQFLSAINWLKLNQLNLGYNVHITTIPATTFRTLSKLQILILSGCGLKIINDQMFAGLTNLHTLDLEYNTITKVLAGAFQNSTNLAELKLNGHQLDTQKLSIEFDKNAFTGIETSLQNFLISNYQLNVSNFWTSISMFVNLNELQAINVDIQQIPDYAFKNNTHLISLDLSSNNISTIQPAALFGPRYTLNEIKLQSNQIRSLSQCLLNNFPQQPAIFLAQNPIHCDCEVAWLYDWVKIHGNPEWIGSCATPSNLANLYLNQFNRSAMCSSGSNVVSCPDLYITTTTTTTPPPIFKLSIMHTTYTSIGFKWFIYDKRDVTRLKIEKSSSTKSKETQVLEPNINNLTFYNLEPGVYYTFCLILEIKHVYLENHAECVHAKTEIEPNTMPSSPTTKPQIGIIVGSAIGGGVLIIIVIIILIVLLKPSKAKKQLPEHITTVPQKKDTSKYITKKAGKAGTSFDNINITAISNGTIDPSRISAGSYQCLNENSVDKHPKSNASRGHQSDSVQDRPLPKTHNGYRGAGVGNRTGHVNSAFAQSTDNLPELSTHEQSDKRPQSNASKRHQSDSVQDRPLPKTPNGCRGAGAAANRTGHVNSAFARSTDNLPEISTNEYNEVTV